MNFILMTQFVPFTPEKHRVHHKSYRRFGDHANKENPDNNLN